MVSGKPAATTDSADEEGVRKRRGKAANGTPRSLLSPDTVSEAAMEHSDGEIEILGEGRHKGSGSSKDPVRIDESPKLPRKIVFAADQKTTTHSFFNRAAEPVTAPAPQSGASTPTGAGGGAPKKVVHSFFASAGSTAPGLTKNGWGCCKEGDEPGAFMPFGEWASHVGWQFDGGVSWPSHRTATEHVSDDGTFWTRFLSDQCGSSSPPPQDVAQMMSAPPFFLDHPAISAVANTAIDTQQTWCDLHRPREAAAVLGNEVEATYLRDWLKALSVGGHDGKRVIRRVHRRKAVNPDLSWIVDDAGLFGDPLGDAMWEDEEIPEPVEEAPLPLGARPDNYPVIGNWVSNTILLTGPSGSGKSAAVHAAATELGWSVFEVYPGIGKRTGTNLLSLVGDVGKNHTVTRDKTAEKKASAASAIKAMFSKVQKADETPPPSRASQGSAADPIDLEDVACGADGAGAVAATASQTATAGGTSDATGLKPQQSLILIDEADILFEEESSFWPALVSLIAESRRPVVITCNGGSAWTSSASTDNSDIGRIPLQTLPLQTILHFMSPPSYLAIPYLSAIAKQHGVERDVSKLKRQQPLHPDLIDRPLPPNGNEPAEIFDLRASITQMQLDRSLSIDGASEGIALADSMSSLATRLEAISFADAFVSQRDWGRLEVRWMFWTHS